MRTCQSVVIDRPCAEVFAFVTDLRNELRWQPEIVAVTLDGPLRVGGHFHETRVTFGRRFEWEFRITELEAPRRIAIETVAGAFPYRGARTFEDLGDGRTRVSEVGELRLPRALRLAGPALAWLARAPLREAYGRLRAILEGDEPRVVAQGGAPSP
ncbi:MAG: SRPBCC family protein [Myxococcales bacterium]|nr:SRPBCC family protein [Myxococcales bacterium]